MTSSRRLLNTQVARLVPVVLLGGALCNCFGTAANEEHFYQLRGPQASSRIGKGPRILVETFTTASGYDTARMAYRISSHEIRYYGYRQWVSEPGRLLTELTIDHLQSTGRFSEIGGSDKIRNPDGVLQARIDAIEQIDQPKGPWQARLAMTFTFRKGSSDEGILLRHTFDVTRDCEAKSPEAVAQRVSEILSEELQKLSKRMSVVM